MFSLKAALQFFLFLLGLSFSAYASAQVTAQIGHETLAQEAGNARSDDPSRWRAVGDTIFFRGTLNTGDCGKFAQILNSRTKNLDVNSAGGDAFEGLCIGRKMRQRQFLNTFVNGICVSSCANYLFLGSRNRKIVKGLVGYHGNISALLKRDPRNDSLRKQLAQIGKSPSEIRRIANEYTATQVRNSKLEATFLTDVGVAQELFERTQERDMGMGDGRSYDFLLPTAETFRNYGIANVEGVQDFELGRAMGMENVIR